MRARLLVTLLAALASLHAAEIEEIRVKREEVFEFADPPRVTRSGDAVTIAFKSAGWCDVSIAIEDRDGHMVRHVASGVLGENAPPPFQAGSLAQKVVWDGKDDQGIYVDDKENMTVRVSLGLHPRFERTLFWSPYKRYGAVTPIVQPAPEGVYVFDSRGKNILRLYDHEGAYVRTVHPPSASKIEGMQGVEWIASPQTGRQVPVLRGFVQGRFLTSSESVFNPDATHHGDPVWCASGMAVHGDRIALGYLSLNRLATDGSTAGLPLAGPEIGYRDVRTNHYFDKSATVGPSSLAFSPDGKTLYLAGFMWNNARQSRFGPAEACMHGVRRMRFESNDPPEDFLGKMTMDGEGKEPGQFAGPTSVACDAKGRVYVSDYLNDRIQVFSPEGQFLKALPVAKPAKLQLDPRSGELIVMSWAVPSFSERILAQYGLKDTPKIAPAWTGLGSFEKPQRADWKPLPPIGAGASDFGIGHLHEVSFDLWAKEPTVWVCERRALVREEVVKHHGKFAFEDGFGEGWENGGIRLYTLRGGKWEETRNFSRLVHEAIHRNRPAEFHGQRLIVNPATRKLYLLEYRGHLAMKSNPELLELDPDTGKVTPLKLPMSSESVCFDMLGHGYLRDDRMVVRFDPATGREITWDYGEEREKVGMGHPKIDVVGGLLLPCRMSPWGHQGGMFVSTRRRLAVTCFNVEREIKFAYGTAYSPGADFKPYVPTLYPGRVRASELHILDHRGQMLFKDAAPGLAHFSGVAMDEEDCVYVLSAGARNYAEKTPFNRWSGTLIKFKPGKLRMECSRQPRDEHDQPAIAMNPANFPQRAHDLECGAYGKAWVEGAEWHIGGVGFMGQNQGSSEAKNAGYTWDDWASRFAFDRYARSFVHELDNFSIAVVDRSGNLMMRFGQYGNEQDGAPLVADGGPAKTHAIGGSEVALARPTVMATDSDRRLFVSDAMNARILSIKLDYHLEARVALKDVEDRFAHANARAGLEPRQ